MYDHTIFCVCKSSKSHIRPQVKWAVSLVIADGHFNLPQGFVWACVVKHTHSVIQGGPCKVTILLYALFEDSQLFKVL